MLSIKLFTLQTIFLQTLYYFNHNTLVKAKEMNTELKLSSDEVSILILSAFVAHRDVKDFNEEELFKEYDDSTYVPVAAFNRGLHKIDSLEKKLLGSTLEVWTWNTGEEKGTQILWVNNQNLLFVTDKKHTGLIELKVQVKKHVFKSLLNKIKDNNLHARTKIVMRLSPQIGKEILLVDIYSPMPGELDMYWCRKNLTEEIIEKKLIDNFSLTRENRKEILMYTIELLKRHMIDKNSLIITKSSDTFNLHIDEMPTAFIYWTTKVPHLQFLGLFNIKLKPYNERYSERIKEIENFKCTPSMLIEFSKTNSDKVDYFNLQFTEYKYVKINNKYSWLDENNTISYNKINFGSKTDITFEPNGIALYKNIQTPKTTPIIEMYFVKEGLSYEKTVFERLKESIDEIIIYINEEINDKVIIDNKSFKINNTEEKFEINLNIREFKPSNTISLLKKTLKDRNGILRICVRTISDTIIESSVYLNDDSMVVVSSNSLLEFLENIKTKNDNIILPSKPSILNEETDSSKLPEKVKFNLPPKEEQLSEDKENSNRVNPPQRSVQQGSTLESHTTGNIGINQLTNQEKNTNGPEQTSESEALEYDSIILPSKPSILNEESDSFKLPEKVKFNLPPKEEQLSEDKENSNRVNPPQRSVQQGSTLESHTTGNIGINQLTNQEKNTNEPEQTSESEALEYDSVILPSKPSILNEETDSSKLPEKVKFKLSPKEEQLSEDKENFNRVNPPQRSGSQVSTLESYTTGNIGINQLTNQEQNTDELEQTSELEASEYICISFIKEKVHRAILDNYPLIKPTYTQKSNNTNPKTEVTETTILNNSIKSIFNSKLEDAKKTIDFDNTVENKKVKSGNTTITIVLVVMGGSGIIGLITYIYFF